MTENPPPPGNFPPPGEGFPPAGGAVPPTPGAYPPPLPGNYPPPPPPGGAYPPPPPGGYPPPPPPGGYPPPPPPQGGFAPPPPGYGPPPGYAPGYGAPGFGGPGIAPFSVGDALSWAWNKFSKNAVPLIVAMVLYGLILGVLGLIIGGILRLSDSGSSTEYISKGNGFDYSAQVTSFGPGGLAVLAVGGIVLMIAAAVIASAYNSGLLRIADGQQTEIGSFFKPRNAGAVVAISVIVGVVSEVINLVLVYFMPIVGSLLGGLINIAIGIFVAFAVVACVDRNLGPIDAIKISVDLVKANFGPVLLVLVVSWLLMLVGVILCFLGLLVTAPLAGLMIVYTYRRLSGGVVAPLTP